MDKESGADSMFGSAARGTSHPAPGENAGPGALSGAGEEGQGGRLAPQAKESAPFRVPPNPRRMDPREVLPLEHCVGFPFKRKG